MPLVLAGCLLFGGATGIEITGNLVLPDEVYLALIETAGLGGVSGVDRYNTTMLAEDVEDFLHDAGYELATVAGTVVAGRMVLVVDEGLLSRIVFKGRGDFRTVQLKLAVSIPQQVFNRPAIERQLEDLRDEFGITDIDLELKPTEAIAHVGPQLQNLVSIAGVPPLPLRGRYELIITLGKRDWVTGFGVHIDIKPPDGVKLGISYAAGDLFTAADRWRLRADVAANQLGRFSKIEPYGILIRGGDRIDLSRATLRGSWSSPPLVLDLRPTLTMWADFMARQRLDLGVRVYRWLEGGALASIGYDFTDGLFVSLGMGVESRGMLDVDLLAGSSPVQIGPAVLGLIGAEASLIFDPGNARIDRRHELHATARLYFGSDRRPRWILRADYQKFFHLGWHDLLIRGRGIAQWGTVFYVDEESMGFATRSVFGTRHWVRRAIGESVELRFSLMRDLFKIGVFSDVALFEKPGRGAATGHRIMAATATGPGLHFLILDAFQADFYYSFGIDSDGVFEHGFSGVARKAF